MVLERKTPDAEDARLIDVLTQLLPFIGYPRTLNGLKAVDEVAAPPKSSGKA
jgi:hypothetical protein